MPKVIIHSAVTVDGKLTGFTPDLSIYYGLAASFREDATLTGADTMLAASGEEAGDLEQEERTDSASDALPLLVITDSRGRISAEAWRSFLTGPYWRAGVSLCSRSTPARHLAALETAGIEAIVTGEDRVNLRESLESLNERYGIETVRTDCGGTLHGALLSAGLADEISLVVSPLASGDPSAVPLFRLSTGSGSPPAMRLEHLERIGGDHVWLRYKVC